jgi:leader peptidase (prepilin peptidase)/N-methyltransferase
MEIDYLFPFYIGLLGLLIGSFLNVVILRLPKVLLSSVEETNQNSPFSLLLPRSYCPKCLNFIAWYDNVPLFSYLWLGRKCRHCHQPISWRYPGIEAFTALLSFWIAHHFGFHLTTLASLFFIWALIALSFIDIDHTFLPDDITFPALWLGLLFNAVDVFTSPTAAILGAAGGYCILWSVYWIFKLITHKEGMGYGDFKLLALLGAWLGWQALPLIILLSSLLGSIIGLALIVFKGKNKHSAIPFGPFLTLAGFVALLWGPKLNQLYLQLIFQ